MSCQRCCLHFLIPHPALFHDAFTGEIYYTKRYRVQEEFMELMMPHHEKTHMKRGDTKSVSTRQMVLEFWAMKRIRGTD
jgi:hypothetical protein